MTGLIRDYGSVWVGETGCGSNSQIQSEVVTRHVLFCRVKAPSFNIMRKLAFTIKLMTVFSGLKGFGESRPLGD